MWGDCLEGMGRLSDGCGGETVRRAWVGCLKGVGKLSGRGGSVKFFLHVTNKLFMTPLEVLNDCSFNSAELLCLLTTW